MNLNELQRSGNAIGSLTDVARQSKAKVATISLDELQLIDKVSGDLWRELNQTREKLRKLRAEAMTSTLAPLGAGGSEMNTSSIRLLSSIIAYNPMAWAQIERHMGPEATFRRVHELADHKVLIAYRTASGTHQSCLVDLNKAAVTDAS